MLYDRIRSHILLVINTLFSMLVLFAIVAHWQAQQSELKSIGLLIAIAFFAPLCTGWQTLPLGRTQHPFVILLGFVSYVVWFILGTTDCNGEFGTDAIGFKCNDGSFGTAFWFTSRLFIDYCSCTSLFTHSLLRFIYYVVAAAALGANVALIFTETKWGVGIPATETSSFLAALQHTNRKVRGVDMFNVGIFDEETRAKQDTRTLCQKIWDYFWPVSEY